MQTRINKDQRRDINIQDYQRKGESHRVALTMNTFCVPWACDPTRMHIPSQAPNNIYTGGTELKIRVTSFGAI